MQKVFVLSSTKKPLMPTSSARARQLLRDGKAKVFRHNPFTIILLEREDGETQPIILKVDPGSKVSGLALMKTKGDALLLLWAVNLVHRGHIIKTKLEKRRNVRRSRRNRKTRYRESRFNNRKRTIGKGWLPPSLMSRVDNVVNWVRKLMKYVPITTIEVETVRFDVQLMENPKIKGVGYQQGTLAGYEVREWLLENRGRKCAYCKKTTTPLQIEHIVPKSRGGSNRLENLTLACESCNQKKGNMTAGEFGYPNLQLPTQSYKDAAAVNATRYRIGDDLRALGLPVTFWSGGLTKFNRTQNGLPKDHWLDAACVGSSEKVVVPNGFFPLIVKAVGRGNRQKCLMNKYGFPRTKPKSGKTHFGFRTGDIVKAIVTKGKNKGTHVGRVTVRKRGQFVVDGIDSISHKYCQLIQRNDGYEYTVCL